MVWTLSKVTFQSQVTQRSKKQRIISKPPPVSWASPHTQNTVRLTRQRIYSKNSTEICHLKVLKKEPEVSLSPPKWPHLCARNRVATGASDVKNMSNDTWWATQRKNLIYAGFPAVIGHLLAPIIWRYTVLPTPSVVDVTVMWLLSIHRARYMIHVFVVSWQNKGIPFTGQRLRPSWLWTTTRRNLSTDVSRYCTEINHLIACHSDSQSIRCIHDLLIHIFISLGKGILV